MSAVLVAALAVAAALVQIGPLALLTQHAIAAPVLPVAIIAGWGVARRAEETWLALLLVPVVFGAASQDRVGVFVLALWPTAVLALLAHRLDGKPAGRISRRLAGASLAAAAGALCYVAMVSASGGHISLVTAEAFGLALATAVTALAAAACAAAVWPWRPRPRGLFE